jgi:carboxymethylenebutenolidase
MDSTVVQVDTDAGSMPAHRWLPEGGHGPGLLLLQEIFGVSKFIRARAADLAALGYAVLAPELYWRLDQTEVDEDAPDALEQGIALRMQFDWDAGVRDAQAALEWLRADKAAGPGIGVYGICFGGGLAFNLTAIDAPDVLVSYYGSDIPRLLELAPRIGAPSLHHFGLADEYIPAGTVARIEAAVSRPGVQFETYPGAGHAFDNPMPIFHHPQASAEAWATTVAFLQRELPVTA